MPIIFIYRFHNVIKYILIVSFSWTAASLSQNDSITVQSQQFNRPFIEAGRSLGIGGYAEANSNWFAEDGVSEGFSLEMRRFNIFVFSALGPRLRFLSELEFEHGTEEIVLETAQLDFELSTMLTLRAGIIMPPIGSFNQNHDSPKWEFIDRPLVSTQIIPATLSEVGFGFYGKVFYRQFTITYDAYVVNGLGDGVILNEEGRTFLQAGKVESRFEEDNNGSPSFSGRLGLAHKQFGEIGVSGYHGPYNSFKLEGESVARDLSVSILALDYNTKFFNLELRGESALALIEIPANLDEFFGERQWGSSLDMTYPIWQSNVLGFPGFRINANLRMEIVDYNVGSFKSTGRNIFDDVRAVVLGLSLRPSPSSALKLNYRRQWVRDILGNPTISQAGLQIGFATYF